MRLVADTPGKVVRWEAADPTTCDVIPGADGRSAVFVAARAGTYLVIAYTAAGDTPSAATRIEVKLGEPEPAPPPKPVVPPVPVVPDAFTAKLQAAYSADPAAGLIKAEALKDIVALYQQAGPFAADATVTTTADLLARLKQAATTLLPAGVLTGVRAAIGAELALLFPANVPLTLESRKTAADAFGRIVAALQQVR